MQMSKLTFKNNAIHKPITEKQYEELCNELLVVLNKMAMVKAAQVNIKNIFPALGSKKKPKTKKEK